MRIVFFYHSLLSDLNNSTAHSLRGVSMELLLRGHEVVVYEPRGASSLQHLLAEHGHGPVARFHGAYPGLASRRYDAHSLDLEAALAGAGLVVVHEWTDPKLAQAIGLHRALHGGYRLFFHATHPAPRDRHGFDLRHYDGVLAAGPALRAQLAAAPGRTRLWREAADTRLFRPAAPTAAAGDVVWVGDWQAGERAAVVREFILEPVKALGLRACVYGAGYTAEAQAALSDANIQYGGWVPNFELPAVLAGFSVALYLPSRARPAPGALPGRLLQALACERPVISGPWDDVDGLLEPDVDYALAHDGAEMTRWLQTLLADPARARQMAENGHAAVVGAHTCAHRADELLTLAAALPEPAAVLTATTATLPLAV